MNRPTHWVTVRGFVFNGGGGLYLSAATSGTHHDVSFVNNEIKGAPNGMGIFASGSSNINIIGNRIHDLGSTCAGAGPGYCHGIYASSKTENWLIDQNVVYNIAGYGIHAYSDVDMPSGFTIQRNDTYKNGVSGYNGAGIIAYGPNHKILNNVSHDNTEFGILLRAVTNPQIYNNTIYNNPFGGILAQSGPGSTCKNNLVIGNGGIPIDGCETIANNITSGSAASFFVNAAADNFALTAWSTAIDSGANLSPTVSSDFSGNVRPQGGGFDVGALEYGSVSAALPLTAPSNLRVLP